MRVIIEKSNRTDKRYMAKFYNGSQKIKTVHFGARGYSNFTIHRDKLRKERYLARHKKNENWNDFMSAGSLSRYILWNKPTLRESIYSYKKRFQLE